MALTSNSFVGDGSTVLFSFTFPYLDRTDIRVSLNGTDTTAYTLENATTVRFNTAPVNGAQVKIYRRTDNEKMKADFYPGSAIRAQDLNDDFTQVLYATQEATVTVDDSAAKSEAAMLAAGAAVVTADEAKATAEGAALISGDAIQKADKAVADSSGAVVLSHEANSKATSAIAAVSQAVKYSVIANVSGIYASPNDETYIEVVDSTGIESFSPLLDIPSGFVGDPGLTVRLRYTTTGNTWRWLGYTANNSEKRYAPLASPTFTGNVSFPAGIITSDGKVGIGTSSALGTAAPYRQEIAGGNVGISSFLNSEYAYQLAFSKSRGSTAGTILQNGDEIGNIVWYGDDGTSKLKGLAGIQAYVDGTPGTNDMPGRLVFSTTADGASSPTERLRIAANGRVTVANSAVNPPAVLTDAATITPDFAAANNFTLALGGNRTLANPTNLVAGQSGCIVITNGGSNTLVYGNAWKFPGGTAPAVTANGVDVLAYYVESATRITARLVGDVK